MAEPGRERDFVLAPNEFVFIQDKTKGQISTYVGPLKSTLAENELPIIYEPSSRKYSQADLGRAISQWVAAPEGSYVVLENPSRNQNEQHPKPATVNSLAEISFGRKINIPGPQTFALWPGQSAKVLEGHRLRTNQYLLVRVYNEEEAQSNQAVMRPADPGKQTDGNQGAANTGEEQSPLPAPSESVESQTAKQTMGQLIVIKGDQVSFYIPPTGIEVLPDGREYVREAVTLERLEYCVLLSEDGNKRYVRGPAVVFPEPTENFIPAANGDRKYKALELNKDMGLYIKVTAEYEEDGKQYKAGDELFITGQQQQLYYPRAEHSVIKYGNKEIHYGVAIPEGESRYVLNKNTGKVETVKGPQIFLADPRIQVGVRRVLTDDEVRLWFPGNERALSLNQKLRELQQSSGGIVTDLDAMSLSSSVARRTMRSFSDESNVEAFSGDSFDRGTKYTPPRTITLDTKFEGAVALNVWNGYAILVIDAEGHQRVEVGPKKVTLDYDETLQVLELSKGKPKSSDRLERTVYLRSRFNQISDIVSVITKDMVSADIAVSYRVNFEGDAQKWFMVENYVKFMTDHARSLLRNAAKRLTIEELNANYIDIVRDTILGATPEEGKRKGRSFEENGVNIYDVEVSQLTIGDSEIDRLLNAEQRATVRETLDLASQERKLAATKRIEAIKREISDQENETAVHEFEIEKDNLDRQRTILEEEAEVQDQRDKNTDATNSARLARKRAEEELNIELADQRLAQELDKLRAEVEAVVEKSKAIGPDFIAALQAFGDRKIAGELAQALSPLAILGGESVADVVQKMLAGTNIADIAKNAFRGVNPASLAGSGLSGRSNGLDED